MIKCYFMAVVEDTGEHVSQFGPHDLLPKTVPAEIAGRRSDRIRSRRIVLYHTCVKRVCVRPSKYVKV